MDLLSRLAWVCLAGALGTGVRYLVALLAVNLVGSHFPWGTLGVNVVGCFFMSIVAYAGSKAAISPALRVVLATGFMGGLTTYSAYNWDTLAFFRDGAWTLGTINVVATFAGCLVAGVAGLAVGRCLFGV
jgi:CrcB protein